MQRECRYCGCMTDGNSNTCPHCGAELTADANAPHGTPVTIEELKQWYKDHNLPPERITRFFIGKDIKEPKAIGIYEENGVFIVYKNKASGERAVRYSGTDEAHAVNEIFTKLRSEIANQKSRNRNVSRIETQKRSKRKRRKSQNKEDRITDILAKAMAVLLFVGLLGGGIIVAIFDRSPSRGYYRYDDREYYYQDSYWYYYDDTSNIWYPDNTGIGGIIGDNSDEYRIYDHQGQRFEDSVYYDSSDDDSSDDDSFWDSDDSWDSDSMDWDSDW